MKLRYKFPIAFLVLLSSLSCFSNAAFAVTQNAAQTISIPIEFETAHHSQHSKSGETFSTKVTQEICLPEDSHTCIPKDTVLQGILTQVKPSRRFHHPGFLAFQAQQAIFPDGNVISLHASHTAEKPDMVMYHPRAQRLHQFVIGEIPDTAVGVGSTKVLSELNEAWGLKAPLLNATTFGISAAFSVMVELIHPEKPDQTFPKRVAWGLANSTGVPDVVKLVRVEPPAVISIGQQAHLKLPTEAMQHLYSYAASLNPPSTIGIGDMPENAQTL